MKKVILVNPSERGILTNAGDRPPLGLAYIAGHLRRNGIDTDIYDLNHDTMPELFGAVRHEEPDAVGVSILTSPMFKRGMKLATDIKRIYPRTKLVAGGYHVSAQPNSIFPEFDYAIVGEGETPILHILYGEESPIIHGERMDLELMSPPARHLLDMSKYNMTQKGKRTATAITSRGCTNNCAFCGNLPYNKHLRFVPSKVVEQDVRQLRDRFGYEGVYFFDEFFTADKKRVKDLTERLKPLGMPYRIATRADSLDEDIVKWLADSGCETAGLGIESGNDIILRNSHKGMTTYQNERAVELLADAGIDVKGFFIIGLPGENLFTAEQTIQFAKRLKRKGLTDADFYPLVPFPGSPISRNPKKFGIKILNRDWPSYLQANDDTLEVVAETEHLKADEIKRLVVEAKREWK